MKAISLFSGIGGDTLAAQWAGFETICFVEWDKFCQAILKKHWPDVPIFGDIDEFRFRELFNSYTNGNSESIMSLNDKQRQGQLGKEVNTKKNTNPITLVYGGDPCQPNSIAGKRRGAEDDRYKWPSMLRIIRESKPAWVVNENPTGRLTMDFYQVLSDLEGEGYETRSFVIPACAVNAPHRRDRVYIVAYSLYAKTARKRENSGGVFRFAESERPNMANQFDDTNTFCQRLEIGQRKQNEYRTIWKERSPTGEAYFNETKWHKDPLEVATVLCGMDARVPARVDRLKALGNAQVPQQIYPIFKAIAEIERMKLESPNR